MGQRVFDPLKIAMWLALVLALALTVMAQHGPTMLPAAPSHSADHSGHDQPMPDHASCVLACMAFVEVEPASDALPLRVLIGLAVIPPVGLLIGQETEWAGRPPWLSGF
jgi:hypothetical protein